MKYKLLLLITYLLSISCTVYAYDFSAKNTNGTTIYYNIVEKGVEVTKNSTSSGYSGTVKIPSTVTYDGTTYDVVGIGNYAFGMCWGLSSITIPNSVKYIGDYAFEDCFSIYTITIPTSVTKIGHGAFAGCRNLNSFNGDNVSEDGRCLIIGGKLIGFAPYGLRNYSVPNTVTTIGESVFCMSSLANITIPSTVTRICEYAFDGCTALTTISIPNPEVTIEPAAFAGCSRLISFLGKGASYDNRCWIDNGVLVAFAPSNLTSYSIPNTVTSIGEGVFYHCDNLTSIVIPSSVIEIGKNAFGNCIRLESISLPASLSTIGIAAFQYCTSLTSITIPNSVTSIGFAAFSGCSNMAAFYGKFSSDDNRCLIIGDKLMAFAPADITSYNITDNITEIAENTFINCHELTSISIPNTVTYIGQTSFAVCTGLESITIPKSVEFIDAFAFKDCSAMTNVIVEWDNPDCTELGQNVFYGIPSTCTLHVPYNTKYLYSSAEQWKNFIIQEQTIDNIDTIFENSSQLQFKFGDNKLIISGTQSGEIITVYNTKGELIGSNVATSETSFIDIPLTSDYIYFVKMGTKVIKIKI